MTRHLLLCLALLTTPVVQAGPTALDLLHKGEAAMRGDGNQGLYRVHIVRPDWQRTLEVRVWDDPIHDRARLELLKPRKARGTQFLKVGGRLSMYLPKLRRQIAISPAMMQDPWMGSDFNNQDLLEASALIDQYDHRIVGEKTRDGHRIYTIESLPKPEAPATWSRLIQEVRGDGLPLRIDFYCKAGHLERRLRFLDPKTFDGHLVPSRWRMEPLKKPGRSTEIQLRELHFGPIEDDAAFHPLDKKDHR